MRNLSNVFKALSDETRLRMLGLLLQEGELCVCDFVETLEITQSKASRHLRRLVTAGLLEDRREGTWVHYRIFEKPASAQSVVIRMLPQLLKTWMDPEILERLASWKKEKERLGQGCSADDRGDLKAGAGKKRKRK